MKSIKTRLNMIKWTLRSGSRGTYLGRLQSLLCLIIDKSHLIRTQENSGVDRYQARMLRVSKFQRYLSSKLTFLCRRWGCIRFPRLEWVMY